MGPDGLGAGRRRGRRGGSAGAVGSAIERMVGSGAAGWARGTRHAASGQRSVARTASAGRRLPARVLLRTSHPVCHRDLLNILDIVVPPVHCSTRRPTPQATGGEPLRTGPRRAMITTRRNTAGGPPPIIQESTMSRGIVRFVLVACLLATLLAGCGGRDGATARAFLRRRRRHQRPIGTATHRPSAPARRPPPPPCPHQGPDGPDRPRRRPSPPPFRPPSRRPPRPRCVQEVPLTQPDWRATGGLYDAHHDGGLGHHHRAKGPTGTAAGAGRRAGHGHGVDGRSHAGHGR